MFGLTVNDGRSPPSFRLPGRRSSSTQSGGTVTVSRPVLSTTVRGPVAVVAGTGTVATVGTGTGTGTGAIVGTGTGATVGTGAVGAIVGTAGAAGGGTVGGVVPARAASAPPDDP